MEKVHCGGVQYCVCGVYIVWKDHQGFHRKINNGRGRTN